MLVLLVALIAAAGIAVACERMPPANSASAPPKVVTVAIRDFKFVPATVTVHGGDTVEWKNDDSVPHTATADGEAQEPAFDSGTIRTGAAWRYVAGKKGTYNYTCTFHPKMLGKLIVQ
jgi:plastocyanin